MQLNKAPIETIVVQFLAKILREPLSYFSESDIHAILYHSFLRDNKEIATQHETSVSLGKNQRGVMSPRHYSTTAIHREYGINGMDYARSDLVLFRPDDIKNITDPINLKTGRGKDDYLRPEYVFEFGTEKSAGSVNLFESHIKGDINKAELAGNHGYVIHIQRAYTRDNDQEKYAAYGIALKQALREATPGKTKVLFFLVGIGCEAKAIFREGKVKMYLTEKMDLKGINLGRLETFIQKELDDQEGRMQNGAQQIVAVVP
jgi:hypothetical protein